MKRGAEFKLIYDAREELAAADDMVIELIKKAKGNKKEQNELIDLFEKTFTARQKLNKIIDAVHAKRYDW